MIKNAKAKNIIKKIIDSPLFILLEFFFSLLGLIVSLTNDSFILRLICAIILSFCFVLIVIYIIVRWFSIRHAKMNIEKQYLKKEDKAGDYTHKFFHTLRNCTNSLDNTETVTKESYKYIAKNLCNLIDDFYTDFLDDDTINVCIKLFDSESTRDTDFKQWKTYTFIRSDSSNTSREEYDNQSIKISQNTDYETILSNESYFQGDYCFISENLKKTKETYLEKYNKEFVCYNPKHKYQSKIIVPIRIKTEYVSKQLIIEPGDYSHHIIGFLCIDSEKTYDDILSDYRNSTFYLSANYAKAFADSLYRFFERYIICEPSFSDEKATKGGE